MNEENEWDHRILATVKEGPADCNRIDEAAAALKQMKRHKAQGIGNKSIQCTSRQKWVHMKCSGIKGSMYKVIKTFVCM